VSRNVLAGDLKSIPLADMLMLCHNTRRTGEFRCMRGEVTKSLEWEQGEIVFARSSMHEDRLCAYLLAHGMVTERQLRSVEMDRGEERLGTTMVRHGILTDSMLVDAVKGHVGEIVYSLFHWKDGAFEFWEGDVSDEKIVLDAGVLNLVLEGARRLDEWALVREKIQSDQVVLSPVSTVEEVSAAADLSDVERDVLGLVDGRLTVREVVDAAGHGEFDGWQALHALLSAGLLRTQIISFDALPASADPSPCEEPEAIQVELVRYGRALMAIMDRLRQAGDASELPRLRRRMREATFDGAHLIRELAIGPDGRINKRILLSNLGDDVEGTDVQQVQTALDGLLQFLQHELTGKVEFEDVLAELAELGSRGRLSPS